MREGYMVQELTAVMSVDELIELFHKPQKVWALCKACPNYGHKWGCPPFNFDVAEMLAKYRHARLFVSKIAFANDPPAPAEKDAAMRSELAKMESRLLDLECKCGGLASANIGGCERCKECGCTRPNGVSCRHPELVRPSLEAYGFDVAALLHSAFGVTLTPNPTTSELMLLTVYFSI